MSTKLIMTFAPHPDESGLGYYRRLASQNALSGWKELARMCEVSVVKTGLLARPEHVSAALALEPAWSQQASSQDEMARGWRGLRRTGADAVCPHCLAESAHMRVSWEHVFMVACPHHKVLLSDTCSGCGDRLSSTREQVERWSCGHDLRSTNAPPATDAQLWVAALLESGGASSQNWAPQVQGAPLDLVSALVRTLCLLSDPEAPPPKSNSAGPRTVRESVEFLRPLDGLLADWPKGFEAHVSARIAVGRPEARTLNSLLGKWYHELRALSECEPLLPFLEAVGRVAAVEFDGVLGLDSAGQTLTKNATHLLVTPAAKLLGINRATLEKFVKSGQLEHRRKKFGTQGSVYELPVAELHAVVAARKLWMVEEEACEKLGVTSALLERLVDAELLVGDSQWRSDVRKGGQFERASVAKLITLLRSHRAVGAGFEGRRIPLRELNARRTGDKKAIIAALRAIATGEIRPLGASPTVGGLEFPLDQVSRHFSRPVVDAGLSVQGLSKVTGWKWESIAHWIGGGLLEAHEHVVRGQSCRVVMPDQLLAFCRAYIPLSDLAKELGTRSSVMSERLHGIEVIGSQLLPGGQRRGGLVRIGDLARSALERVDSEL